MNEKKLLKQQKNLIDAELMEADDRLIDFVQCSYLEKVPYIRVGKWKQGWLYFTERKIICLVGFVGGKVVISYKDIRKIEKSYQSLFPMGIKITCQDPENGEEKWEKFSVSGRKKWLALLEEKTGISVDA